MNHLTWAKWDIFNLVSLTDMSFVMIIFIFILIVIIFRLIDNDVNKHL